MSFSNIIRRTVSCPLQNFASASSRWIHPRFSPWSSYFNSNLIQRASYWQEIIRTSLSPTDASTIYEDPSKAAQRSMRAQNAEGLLRRKKFTQLRHEKQWMEKKKKKREVIFKNKKRGVDELRNYLKFKVDSDAMWKLQKSRSRALDNRDGD